MRLFRMSKRVAPLALPPLLAAVLPLAMPMPHQMGPLALDTVQKSPAAVIAADGMPAPAAVKVVREWSGPLCKAKLVNEGKTPVKIKEVILLDIPHALPPETHLYGE